MRRAARQCCKWGGLVVLVAFAAALEVSFWWDLAWVSRPGWGVGFCQGSAVLGWSMRIGPRQNPGFQVSLHPYGFGGVDFTWLPLVKTNSTGSLLLLPLWIVLAAGLVAIFPLWWRDHLRVRFGRGGRCPLCGYDRRGLLEGAECPECGTTPTLPALPSK